MEKKGLGEKLYKISISRGFVCEAGSGRIKDILIDFNLSELEDFIYQRRSKLYISTTSITHSDNCNEAKIISYATRGKEV